jgi:ankyrin repeat protein
LAHLLDPFDCSFYPRKPAKQHGASVNALAIPQGETPLHNACDSDNVTNLDFIELLLQEDADSSSRDHMGQTPLMFTIQLAPGAAKFMPNSLRPRR